MGRPDARVWSVANRNLGLPEEWLVPGLKQRKHKVSLGHPVVREGDVTPKTTGDTWEVKGASSWSSAGLVGDRISTTRNDEREELQHVEFFFSKKNL